MNIYSFEPNDHFLVQLKEWCKNNQTVVEQKIFKKNCKIPSPMLGLNHTEETKKLLSKLNSGENNSFYGKKHTEESKRKIGLKSIGRIPSKENLKKRSISCSISKRKKWILFSPDNKQHMTDNLKQFCKDNSLNYGNICSVSRGERLHNKGWKIIPYSVQENN
jgi:hypothetical protein